MTRRLLESYEFVVRLTLPTSTMLAAITVSSFTFYLTVSC
jgi:hypothetical protein